LLLLFSTLTVAIVAGIGVIYEYTPYNYVYFFILGGVLNGTYAIGMAKMGDRFSGADLAGSSALMTMLWAAGAMIGPVLGGVGIDLWDPYGLIVAGTLIALSYLPLVFYEKRKDQPA
ncbi:MAG: MFS family permease, partial [Parvibaculaceae bacterium]